MQDVRGGFGIPERVPLIGTVAALVDHKDHWTFLEAAARLVRGDPPTPFAGAHFLIVGDGPLRPGLEARASALGLSGRVHFAGFRDDVPAILPALDVLLFTSKEEGLGSSILEAWACGVPVVATAAGGIPELVQDGETGLLAPVGDAAALARAVERVLSTPSLRAALVAAATSRLAAFGAGRMAEGVLAVYREVVAERAAGAATDSASRALGSFLPKSRFQR